VPVIACGENLEQSTCCSVLFSASKQTSCISKPHSGRPTQITLADQRLIQRAIVRNPKITAVQLKAEACPHVCKKTIYRYLKKSGIQKWRCKKRPFLTPAHAVRRLAWARIHDGKPLEFWKQLCWSNECSIEWGKEGQIQWVYREWGKFYPSFLKSL
jgi:hypothetical protein